LIGPIGEDGKQGPDGRDAEDGPPGLPGKTGNEGQQGEQGDKIKSELKVHLNALKGYVDMKFDVLKSMMTKYSSKTGAKPVELGEGKMIASQIAQAHAHLTSTLDAFASSTR